MEHADRRSVSRGRFEAIVSDFGGVLTTPLFGAFARFQEEHGIALESLGLAMAHAAEAHGENPLYALERGEMPQARFYALVEDGLEAATGRRVEMGDFAERYFGALETNEEMLAFLRRCRDERGLRLAMLTNNVREWEPRWRAMIPDVDALFDPIVDSAFVGMRKPDPAIYALTVERVGVPAERCVFIDDLEVNCDAARDAGMAAVRFETTAQAIADVEALLG